ncbi:MAG: ABC transporter ATP-binding protein [Bdellovibrio sp.]|nr:ABC transporter ATP-binding protein [Bdellovibrio sp.]
MFIDCLVCAENIHKSFKELKALRGVDLFVSQGEFVAILGPNGAGKTTFVEIIEGIQLPDKGSIRIKGLTWKKNAREIHKLIGLSLQETKFFERITTLETLRLFASFFDLGEDRVQKILDMVNLRDKAQARTVHLSGGQRQKLALGISILNEPEVLILDEPTTGLDPAARREIWNILSDLKSKGKTSLILTTHYMEEANFLCDRIIMMDKGIIIKEGSPQQLLKENGKANLDELFIFLTGRGLSDETVGQTY